MEIIVIYNYSSMAEEEMVDRDALRMVGTMLRFVRIIDQRARSVLGTELTLNDLSVLAAIERGSDLPSAVADALRLDRPRVTRITDHLASLGYVTRAVDQEDRRRCRLGMTTDGRRALTEGRASISAAVDAILENLPEDDRSVLLRSVEALRPLLGIPGGLSAPAVR